MTSFGINLRATDRLFTLDAIVSKHSPLGDAIHL